MAGTKRGDRPQEDKRLRSVRNAEQGYPCIVCGQLYSDFACMVNVPKEQGIRRAWSKSLGIDFATLSPSVHLLVCKEHFAPGNFVKFLKAKATLTTFHAFRGLTLHRWAIPRRERQLSKLLEAETNSEKMPSGGGPVDTVSGFVNTFVESPHTSTSRRTTAPGNVIGKKVAEVSADSHGNSGPIGHPEQDHPPRVETQPVETTRRILPETRRVPIPSPRGQRRSVLPKTLSNIIRRPRPKKRKIEAPQDPCTSNSDPIVPPSTTLTTDDDESKPLLVTVKQEVLDEVTGGDPDSPEVPQVEFNLDFSDEITQADHKRDRSNLTAISTLQTEIPQTSVRGSADFYLVSKYSLLQLLNKCTACSARTTPTFTRKGLACVAEVRCRKCHNVFVWHSDGCEESCYEWDTNEDTQSQMYPWHLQLVVFIASLLKIRAKRLAILLNMIFNTRTTATAISNAIRLISHIPFIHTRSSCHWSSRIKESMLGLIVNCRMLILIDMQTYAPAACIEVPGIEGNSPSHITQLLSIAILRLHILGIRTLSTVHLLLPESISSTVDQWKPLLVDDGVQLQANATYTLKAALPFFTHQGFAALTTHYIIEETVKVILFFQPLLNSMPEAEARATLRALLYELIGISETSKFSPPLVDLAVVRDKLTVLTDSRYSDTIRGVFQMFRGVDVYQTISSVYRQFLNDTHKEGVQRKAITIIPVSREYEPVSRALRMANLLENERYSVMNVLNVLFLLPTE